MPPHFLTPPMRPHVSIITPTAHREHLLPAIARCVLRQRVEWEWLILDDSAQPSAYLQALASTDARIRYFHSPARMSIGAKRNFLVAESRGCVIAHFDDDDHYAPHYLAHMLATMQESHADLIKLSGFFMYAPHTQFFGYMDLNAKVGLHYELSGRTVSHIEFHEKMQIGADFILFYGFSYVYDKARAAISAFDDVDLYDDESFIRRVVNAGRKVIAVDDPQASCLHLVHPASTSRCFSRHSMPSFLLPTLFPCYEGFVE
ncbi:glycosyltransferase family A protein [Paraburkholderia sp. PREW-6R]|uniref:glycosyltransferase family 2 protein n=1 Tax=Paraburkholderia sp. PREW-6R TaxID=3141544 RepID=UPI0031F4D555